MPYHYQKCIYYPDYQIEPSSKIHGHMEKLSKLKAALQKGNTVVTKTAYLYLFQLRKLTMDIQQAAGQDSIDSDLRNHIYMAKKAYGNRSVLFEV